MKNINVRFHEIYRQYEEDYEEENLKLKKNLKRFSVEISFIIANSFSYALINNNFVNPKKNLYFT